MKPRIEKNSSACGNCGSALGYRHFPTCPDFVALPEPDTGIDREGIQVISEKAVKELQDWLLKPKVQRVSTCMEQAFFDARNNIVKPGVVVEVSPETLVALKRPV